ncbi:MAG: C1 family peptidase [Chloroflexi bacterium]|nr:C1 family peptidase [Chloroflexota bacterium]
MAERSGRRRTRSGPRGARSGAPPARAVEPLATRPEAAERRPEPRDATADRQMGRRLDAMPDRVDARDYLYRPRLSSLPAELVNSALGQEILDQGTDGACTGFALAAVINFLLAQQGRAGEQVSPRMLYEMARRYDEWPGDSYEGSSARGAMKGWVRHGVCSRTAWSDDKVGPEHLSSDVAQQAMATPGGAFYRVSHRDVRDVHCALAEVGVLYLTLMVHEGWAEPGPIEREVTCHDGSGNSVKRRLPVIRRVGRADAGHAVAIVGYTREGFVIQNSWGTDWGAEGFALLPYEDYMLHATDVWVVQLGVPVDVDLWQSADGAATSAGLQRATPAIPLAKIRPYVVDVGNNGELSDRGNYWTTEDDVKRLFSEYIPAATAGWAKKRILLYLHGGLNSESDVARRIVSFGDVLRDNQIYPIHIMWETNWDDTIRGILEDCITDVDERAGNWFARFREGLVDARDWTIEQTASWPGTRLWSEMKENARISSTHPDGRGGMQILHRYASEAIASVPDAERDDWELHVVGHSAGSIYAAHAVANLSQLGVPFKTMQFMAPAIRSDLFKHLLLRRIRNGECPLPTLYLLSEKGELDDDLGPYGKSLLYLVSNAFEDGRETPLLGMRRYVDGERADADLTELFGGTVDGRAALVIAGASEEAGNCSKSRTHGGFDSEPETLNSVLVRILGGPPVRPFDTRDLQF